MTISEKKASRIAIVGGTGKVAKHLITQLHARGDEAVAIFRNADRADEVAELGAVPVVLDIESASVDELAATFEGCDAVVFSAGAGGGNPARTRAVDFEGAVTAIDAATHARVSRFVIVSAIGVGAELPGEPGDSMRPYYEAKRDADLAVEASGLEYTIVRPGGLTDDAATGLVTIGDTVERGNIARADVAAVIVAALDNPGTIGHAWEVVAGDRPIADAITDAL
ncbi:SDR family oxidoreductase [Conyzicola nivalis]|uniref:NAD-dependent dehydratase n=1 Tax=Conyzicola nivalis TaxID=1477021 RepID=A0A916SH87_9MICO|nr:SDR family oxidoreductase [Conyzicola nivalis]GGB00068.1 NAD-dependent dehydratase [Conyzicola nivalis]